MFDVSGLPAYLPSVAARVHRRPTSLRWVAVHAARAVLRADGRGLRPLVERDGVRRALGLDPATPCALHFYVPDRPLEGFWRARRELYPWIADQFELVFTPNFSVYEDAPRLEHLINIKRSAVVYAEMLEAGIPAVPDIGWYEVRELDRWVAWLNEIGPPLAAFSFQGVGVGARGSRAWMGYLAGLRYLGERLRPDVGLVLVGVAAPDRVRAALQAAGRRRIAILNSEAWSLSRNGRFMDGSAAGREMHRDAVFWWNVDAALSAAYLHLQEEGGRGVEGLRERFSGEL